MFVQNRENRWLWKRVKTGGVGETLWSSDSKERGSVVATRLEAMVQQEMHVQSVAMLNSRMFYLQDLLIFGSYMEHIYKFNNHGCSH